MLPFPDGIDERHVRDGPGMPGALAPAFILGSILVLALFGLFGGAGASTLRSSTPDTTLEVQAPTTLRSGMFFEMRVEAVPRRRIEDAVIAIPASLWRDMTINTSLPEPGEEGFKAGSFRLHYGPVEAGERIAVKFDGQINPNLAAGAGGDIALLDGERRLAAVPTRIRVLP